MHQTVVRVGRLRVLFGRVVRLLLWVSSALVLLLTFIASCFPELLNIGTASGFLHHFPWEYTALGELRIFRGFPRASEVSLRHSVSSGETSRIPLFR